MPLFANEFPTKKIDRNIIPELGDDWIVIQALPRSYFVNEEKELAAVGSEGIQIHGINKGNVVLDNKSISSDKITAILEKEAELDYLRVKNSIKEWSSLEPVTLENVKKLHDSIFIKLLREIEKINHLTEDEQKNSERR
ncbi:MAG: hypothetical protein H0Z35_12375 [Thermoanaerobacteraceae bacterium]|nr:hypothetical protein [Thermoanaerobacteraceae bacterium]